jgi:hypothetical protein
VQWLANPRAHPSTTSPLRLVLILGGYVFFLENFGDTFLVSLGVLFEEFHLGNGSVIFCLVRNGFYMLVLSRIGCLNDVKLLFLIMEFS